MIRPIIVTPLPPTLFTLRSLWRRGRFGRQVGAGNFLLFPLSERNAVPLLLKERGKGVRCKEAGRSIIISPLRGSRVPWGAPYPGLAPGAMNLSNPLGLVVYYLYRGTFNHQERNVRVFLPVRRSVVEVGVDA